MSEPVNSLIVTHSGRILDLLNGIMHETEINDPTGTVDDAPDTKVPPIRDPPRFKDGSKPGKGTNKLIKIGNFGVVKLEISPSDKGNVNTITLLEKGYGDKAGQLKKTKDDSKGTAKWQSFNNATDDNSTYVFYIVRHGFAEHNEIKEKRSGEVPSGKTDDPVEGKKKGKRIKTFTTGIPYINTKKDTSLVKDDSRHSGYIAKAIGAINGDLGGRVIQHLFVSDLLRTRQTLQYLLKREPDIGEYLQISPNTEDIYVLPCAHEISFPKKWRDILFQAPENIVADKPKNPFKCDRKYRVNWDKYDDFYFTNDMDERDGYFTSSKNYDMCNGPTMIENAIDIIKSNKGGSADGSVVPSSGAIGGGTRYRNYTRKRDTRKRRDTRRDTRKRDTRKRDTRRDTRRDKRERRDTRKRDTSKLRKK